MKQYLVILLFIAGLTNAVTNVTKTVKATGGDYPDLATAEAAWSIDLVTTDQTITYDIQGTWASAASATTFDGATTDAAHTITIQTSGSARHSGVWDGTNAYRLSASYRPLYLNDDYITADGLQVEITGTGDYRYGIESDGGGATIKNCIVKFSNTGTIGGIGITTAGALPQYIYNNIVYDVQTGTSGRGISITSGDNNGYVYNNTIQNCYTGIWISYLDAISVNNIFYGCTTPIDGNPSTVTLSHNNATDNASITYTGCGSCGAGDILSMTDPFNDIANDNFHLASATSDGAEDGSAESSIVTNDIDGDSRPQSTNWDIGADEFLVTASTPSLPNYIHGPKGSGQTHGVEGVTKRHGPQ